MKPGQRKWEVDKDTDQANAFSAIKKTNFRLKNKFKMKLFLMTQHGFSPNTTKNSYPTRTIYRTNGCPSKLIFIT